MAARPSRRPDQRRTGRSSSGPTTARTAPSCGRATAPRPAPCWSRTSTPACAAPVPSYLTNVERHAVLRGRRRHHGLELWKSDGTAAGTVLVKDINPGANGSSPERPHERRTARCSSAPMTATNGTELWKSDGTAAGTVLVKDINPGANGSGARLPDERRTARCSSRPTTAPTARSCGRATAPTAGTVLVKDIQPGRFGMSSSYPVYLTNVNGTLFFRPTTAPTGTSCGRATARRPAPCWSRTSGPAGTARVPST